MVKKGYKTHLASSDHPKSVCGITYPVKRALFLLQAVDCKRCKATYEYRSSVEAEKDIAYEKEGE